VCVEWERVASSCRELKTSQCFVFANARDENLSPLCVLLWCEMRNIRANSNSSLRDEHVKQNLAFLLSLLMCECIFYLNLHCLSSIKRKCNTQLTCVKSAGDADRHATWETRLQRALHKVYVLLFSSSSIFCLRLSSGGRQIGQKLQLFDTYKERRLP
jgi:hypothetical protein